MLQYETLPVTAFEQNCSVLWCDRSMEGAVMDPGGNVPQILAIVARHGIRVRQILLTHGHVDHCAAAADLAQQLQVPIVGPHEADRFWIEALPEVAAGYGFPPAQTFVPTRWLQDGDTVQVGQETLQVLHCPGHTPGHVVFYVPGRRHAFVGDVLFAGSVGRTDFPQGSHEQLVRSIVQKLWPLGDDITFTPGHGPESHFGHERQTNPFVRGA